MSYIYTLYVCNFDRRAPSPLIFLTYNPTEKTNYTKEKSKMGPSRNLALAAHRFEFSRGGFVTHMHLLDLQEFAHRAESIQFEPLRYNQANRQVPICQLAEMFLSKNGLFGQPAR
jgi:hypothetical protein